MSLPSFVHRSIGVPYKRHIFPIPFQLDVKIFITKNYFVRVVERFFYPKTRLGLDINWEIEEMEEISYRFLKGGIEGGNIMI